MSPEGGKDKFTDLFICEIREICVKLSFIRVIRGCPVFQGNATNAGPGIRILRVQSWLNPSRRGRSFQEKMAKVKLVDPFAASQPLPAREVISSYQKQEKRVGNSMSQPLPAREVISRKIEYGRNSSNYGVSTPPGKGGHFKS